MQDQSYAANSLYFCPKKVLNIGFVILTVGLTLGLPFVFLLASSNNMVLPHGRNEDIYEDRSLSFSLGINDQLPILPIPKIEDEITFSFEPLRPGSVQDQERLLVKFKKGSDVKRVTVPCRLDIELQRDKLKFSKNSSALWIELNKDEKGQIQGTWYVSFVELNQTSSGTFVIHPEKSPIQSAQEFQEMLPFKILADSKWLGQDLLKESSSGERIEVAPHECLELSEGYWLVWNGLKWEVADDVEKATCVARIESKSPKGLVLEGWSGNDYVRFLLPSGIDLPFKIKGEELFSALRVRSEKQISCVLEKQCMVLKVGDWVLKSGGRWKILRKKEEREAFLNGKLLGELFIFDQICQKQGQKMIQGRVFNSNRTQVAPIELFAQSARAVSEKRIKGLKK